MRESDKRRTSLVSFVCANLVVIWPAYAGFFEDVGHAVEKGVSDAGHAIEKGTHDAGNAIEKGTNDAGHAIEKGTHDTGHTLEKATDDIGRTLEKAAHDVGNALTVHPNDETPDYPAFFIPIEDASCPTLLNKNNWKNYLTHPARGFAVAGVQFRYANKLDAPRALKNIDPSACYTIRYSPSWHYESHRAFSYSQMKKPYYDDIHALGGLPGNPEDNDINVDGVLLRYDDDSGQIYDLRGRVAGVLVCYISNDCQPFAY